VVGNVAAGDTALLQVNDLHTDITTRQGVVHAVSGVSLCIDAGETVGLVGESGCGKTMTAMSLVRLLPGGARITSGSIKLDGRDLVPLADSQIRSLRGSQIGVVFQDPMTSLNPTMAIGHQISESFRLHRGASRRQARSRALEVLGLVGMPRPSERLGEYPHQLSGGMRQRAMIALALVCEPKLLIADEPTTALDATIQAQILELLDNLRQRLGMGMLLVTHDMGVIAGHADRVLVMYAGKIAESAPTEGIFADPRHRYTEALLKSVPSLDQDRSQRLSTIPGAPPDLSQPPRGCSFAPRCSFATDQCNEGEPVLDGETEAHRYACYHPRSTTAASVTEPAGHQAGRSQRPATLARESPPILSLASVSRRYPVGAGVFRRGSESIKAVSNVSLTVAQGETFGLVGESGCGKSTLGRLIVAMERPDEGSVLINGTAFDALSKPQQRQRRRDVQLVFQDSYSAMNPKMRIGSIMRDPLRVQRVGSAAEQRARVTALLDSVGLPQRLTDRFPHELSGGQRQRVGFARALTLSPKLIVADEPVSALDVSVQAQIINLMQSLQSEFNLTYVIVSHDLSVVRYVADRIGVMYLGRLVEIGPSDAVYTHPAHPYTAGLLESIPIPRLQQGNAKQGSAIRGELPSAIHPPSGCPFRTRCPRAQDRCANEAPILRGFGSGHSAACHFPLISIGASADDIGRTI
jgi:peptide/nickel transport system ATP-binding protein